MHILINGSLVSIDNKKISIDNTYIFIGDDMYDLWKKEEAKKMFEKIANKLEIQTK
jgi:hypothetical protein